MQSYPEEFIDKHKDRHAIVIGSGPSVRDFQFDDLPPGLVTLGSNAIGKIFSPDYYVVTDKRAWAWYSCYVKESLDKKPTSKLIVSKDILDSSIKEKTKNPVPDGALIIDYPREAVHGPFEVGGPIFHGRTVGIVMLNLAFQMGFKRVYMIGIDGYSGKGPHYFYDNTRTAGVHEPDERDKVVAQALENLVPAMWGLDRELFDLSDQSAWLDIVPRRRFPWGG